MLFVPTECSRRSCGTDDLPPQNIGERYGNFCGWFKTGTSSVIDKESIGIQSPKGVGVQFSRSS